MLLHVYYIKFLKVNYIISHITIHVLLFESTNYEKNSIGLFNFKIMDQKSCSLEVPQVPLFGRDTSSISPDSAPQF